MTTNHSKILRNYFFPQVDCHNHNIYEAAETQTNLNFEVFTYINVKGVFRITNIIFSHYLVECDDYMDKYM